MRTPCPCCGAALSLDVLIANDNARELFRKVYNTHPQLGKQLIQYFTLFRPSKTKVLTWSRTVSLLNGLMPDIEAEQIARKGSYFPAQPEAWCWAIDMMMLARDAGKLSLPLSSHGYLYEVIISWNGQLEPLAQSIVATSKQQNKSKTQQSMDILNGLENYGPVETRFINTEFIAGMRQFIVLRMEGTPANDTMELVGKTWLDHLYRVSGGWDEEKHKGDIEKAFNHLLKMAERWPTPKQLIDLLPPRVSISARLEPLTEEDKRKGQENIKHLFNNIANTMRMPK